MSTTAVATRPVRSGARRAPRPRPARSQPRARRAQPARATARRAPRRRPNVALRRRIAAVLTVALLVLALGITWAMTSEAAPEGVVFEATVVVAPGETVWDIANQYVPDGTHPQAYVAQVLRYNDLEADSILPGTALRLPRP